MRISRLFLFLLQISVLTYGMEKLKSQPTAVKKNIKKDEKIEQEILDGAVKEGVESLKAGRLKELDPAVGDWGCHERAPEVVRLYRQNKISGSISNESLEFIGLSKLLTKAKKRTQMASLTSPVHETTDHKRITNMLNRDKGDNFIARCQSKMAQMTVALVQQQAKEINDEQLIRALAVVKSDETRFDRKHCPFYPGVKTVLLYALKNAIPIIVKIARYDAQGMHRYCLIFKKENEKFCAANLNDFDDAEAALVFEGTSSAAKQTKNVSQADVKQFNELSQCDFKTFIEMFKMLDIFKIILINAALHQQFVGKKHQATQIPFDKHNLQALECEMQQYQERGQHKFVRNPVGGPYAFIVDHVFPTTIKEFKNDQGIFEFLQQALRMPTMVCDIINAGISVP